MTLRELVDFFIVVEYDSNQYDDGYQEYVRGQELTDDVAVYAFDLQGAGKTLRQHTYCFRKLLYSM